MALAAALLLPQADVLLYHRYGLALLHGHGAHRLPLEYPALTALVFAVPLALPLPYHLTFALEMAVILAALVEAARRLGAGDGWNGRAAAYLGLGTVAVLFARFDLVPALATFVAVLEARRGRFRAAWVAAALGGALKLFPLLLLPGFALAERRATGRLPWRRAAVTAALGLAYAGLQQALFPGSFLGPLRYEWRRGFEFSSLGGSLTAVVDPLHLRFTHAFGAWEILGAGRPEIQLMLGLGVLAGLAVLWLLAGRGRLSVDEVSLAVLSLAVLTDRALAPQYLVWLAPLWALWPTRRSWCWAAALTTLTFPVVYLIGAILDDSLLPATLVGAARNAVLLGGTACWLFERLKSRPQEDVGVGAMLAAPTTAAEAPVSVPRVDEPIPVGVATAAPLLEGGAPSAIAGS